MDASARTPDAVPTPPDVAGPTPSRSRGGAAAARRSVSPSWFDTIDEAALRRRAGAKWAKYPPDVLPAFVADMDFPLAPPVRDALAAQLHDDDYGYPWPGQPGEPTEAAVAYAEWAARRYGWQVDPSAVRLTVDVLQPLQACIQLFAEPGDGVVIQTPIYPPFLPAVEGAGRRVVDNPLGPPSEGYPLDLDGLRAAIDGRTKMILLCNPHNPTGRVFRRDELEGLAELAVRHDLVVVSDEIHADFVYPGGSHIPFATLGPEVEARTVTLTAATKTFSFAGLRLALMVFGSPQLRERYETIPRFLLGGPSAPGIAASIAGWRNGDAWVDALVDYLDGNRRFVTDFVAEHLPGVSHPMVEATYLAWLDCRPLVAEGRCTSPAAFFLEQAKVALNDGADFGPHGMGFARLNFATSRAMLTQVLERLAGALTA